jgi:5-methylcytosine-specific restriction endonuclease McrA
LIEQDQDFLAPRRCMREPIPEIFAAAELLNCAADAHVSGDRVTADRLIRRADLPSVREWTDSLWGSRNNHPEQAYYHRLRPVEGVTTSLNKDARPKERMPTTAEKALLIERYGHKCAFCGIPLIRPEVRQFFTTAYPEAAYWGRTNETQHAGFQCLWLQYDHVVPHSHGGVSIDNLVVTCAGCNYGRVSHTLEEFGLLDPRNFPIEPIHWDGLERVLKS